MLKKMHMQEIQDLKLRGYSMNEIIHYFEERGRKPPSLPTLRKYFKMEALPEVPNQNLIKEVWKKKLPFCFLSSQLSKCSSTLVG